MKPSLSLLFLSLTTFAAAQITTAPTVRANGPLDPSLQIQHPKTVASFHQPLPEEYIWTADDATVAVNPTQASQLKRDDWKVEPHYFRRTFSVAVKPELATLYIAGPRKAHVWINGVEVAQMSCENGHHISFCVKTANVASALRSGANVIAIEAVRGYGGHHHTNALKTAWLNSGEILAVKIMPAAKGFVAPPLVLSDGSWSSTISNINGWQNPGYNDASWKKVASVGGVESSIDFFQWNADAGMYAWPGYLGEAPYMANYRLPALKTDRKPGQMILDFGRELDGRLVMLPPPRTTHVTIRMGESMGELTNAPYLGDLSLTAPGGHEGRGPKTGFRYAQVDYDPSLPPPTIVAEGIYYPVEQTGTFESSDAQVNKIFQTAVYTAHLAMQDSIFDGLKRDRGRWIGDDEVIDRVILDCFGDQHLIKEALEDTLGPAPVTEPVNGIPGYSAWWLVSEYEYVNRTGDLEQARAIKPRMLELLSVMSKDLDTRNVFVGIKGEWPFVDWTKDFNADSPEARRATDFEYILAIRKASLLLNMLGDSANSKKYSDIVDAMEDAAKKYLEDTDGSFGDRWEANAIAVLSHSLTSSQQSQAKKVLTRTTADRKPYDTISPYYANYVLQAMSALDEQQNAMQWMKSYWGGMLDNGATSFWEAWDPAWSGGDTHAKLDADNQIGYNASLSHGWSSGPAAWLLEFVLGVHSHAPGYKTVTIAPTLAGLQWARGTVATPLGTVKVDAANTRVVITIPEGMNANVYLSSGSWTHSGASLQGGAEKPAIELSHAGRYEFLKK